MGLDGSQLRTHSFPQLVEVEFRTLCRVGMLECSISVSKPAF